MSIQGIHSLRILPTLAIGRLGSSDDPMDNYDVDVVDPLGFRQLQPAETLRVDIESGCITHSFTPDTVRFRDDKGRIRPVAPFLEVWFQPEPEADLEPLTADYLQKLGLDAKNVEWCVKVGNTKASRRTGKADDEIQAVSGWFSDHVQRVLAGQCTNFLPNKTLPLGAVQYLNPTQEFPHLRLRFTPAGGYVYGPKQQNNVHDPNLRGVVYDRTRGTWADYAETGSEPLATIPGAIYFGEERPDTPGFWSSFGYLDDECDGLVEVRLIDAAGERTSLGAFARIVAGPPTFAPDSFPVRSVADELEQALLGPDAEDPPTREEVEEIVRRALENIRLMNTEFMNNGAGGRGRAGMARMDNLDTQRALEPIMDPSIVDNLALRARHESVLLGLESGTLAWFAYILREYTEIGDLTDNGRRKMPAMMRGADARHLALTRRQVSKVKRAADAIEMQHRKRTAAIKVAGLVPITDDPDEKSGGAQ